MSALHAECRQFDPVIAHHLMKEKILKDLKTLRDNLEQEAQEARKHGGAMAMKLGSRVQIIQNAINYIELYERIQKT